MTRLKSRIAAALGITLIVAGCHGEIPSNMGGELSQAGYRMVSDGRVYDPNVKRTILWSEWTRKDRPTVLIKDGVIALLSDADKTDHCYPIDPTSVAEVLKGGTMALDAANMSWREYSSTKDGNRSGTVKIKVSGEEVNYSCYHGK